MEDNARQIQHVRELAQKVLHHDSLFVRKILFQLSLVTFVLISTYLGVGLL